MFFSTLNFLATLSLSIAAPLSNGDVSSVMTSLSKRFKETSNCGLDIYPNIGQWATKNGINELLGDFSDSLGGESYVSQEGEIVWGIPGKCKMFWCRDQVSFGLCVDSDTTIVTFEPETLGQQLLDTYKDCYGDAPAESDNAVRALQYWGDGYNLLLQGNGNCDQIGMTW